ncbi:MAG TPA: hypothetical protein VIC03_08570 [Gemmatimonadaceae bacterium]
MALPSKELSDRSLDALITREQTRVVAPLTEWHHLSMSLKQEGLIRDAAGQRTRSERAYVPSAEPAPRGSGWVRTTGRWTLRLAASAALVGVGIVAGRGMTFGQSLITQIQQAVSDSTGGSSVHVAGKPFTSPASARQTLLRAQTDYQSAAAFLDASDSIPQRLGGSSLYEDRLAGLDEMTTASLSALKDAPRDPLLNQYFLSAAAAREATLQQLGNSLPVGATMERF